MTEQTEETEYFFDSYALIEILNNAPAYAKFAEKKVVTTFFNLVELYYIILRDYNTDTAKQIYKKYKPSVVNITDEVLFKAMQFRLDNISKDVSYVDCIGYTYAKEHNMKFLTGDKEFEDMENVEYVK